MSVPDLPSPLLVVTDRHGSARPLVETVAACLDGGARWIWFRDRDMAVAERRRCGERLCGIVRGAGGIFTVGGDIDLAAELGADGVHLGAGQSGARASARSRLGATAVIGISTHGAAEVSCAARADADYVTLSPVFASASKPGYGPALGRDGIAAGVQAGLPVIALGGIDAERVAACRSAGAAGVAVMGALMRAADPAAAARRLLAAWNAASDA